ncbi:MAG: SPFH domain-containing protein [Verrucomicrobiota bacterium]|jgi:membrane protease subunit HflK
MSEHDHPDYPQAPETRDAGSQALAEALRSSFAVVKIAMAALVAMVFLAGFFTVKPGEKAVILRFGKPLGEGQKMLLSSGRFYWSFPYPIDEVIRIPIQEIQKVTSSAGWYPMTHEEELAFETSGTEPPAGGVSLNPLNERYVITADRNIIHTRAVVSYHIDDPRAAIFSFAGGTNQQFNLAGISNAVQSAADNALVATAARFNVDDILTLNVAGFQDAVSLRIKELVERDHLGVVIETPCQVKSAAPRQLADDFRQVTAARQNRDNLIQVALGEHSRITNAASAQAVSITNAAESARERYVTSIQAETTNFTSLLPQYQSDPRLYAQLKLAAAMPQILSNADKYFLPQRADGKARELRVMLNREPPQNARSTANP